MAARSLPLTGSPPDTKALCLNRATAGDGPKAIQTTLGEDSDGMRLLWVLLEMARDTWDGYMQRGISRDIFACTMKFVPRACDKMSVKE